MRYCGKAVIGEIQRLGVQATPLLAILQLRDVVRREVCRKHRVDGACREEVGELRKAVIRAREGLKHTQTAEVSILAKGDGVNLIVVQKY